MPTYLAKGLTTIMAHDLSRLTSSLPLRPVRVFKLQFCREAIRPEAANRRRAHAGAFQHSRPVIGDEGWWGPHHYANRGLDTWKVGRKAAAG